MGHIVSIQRVRCAKLSTRIVANSVFLNGPTIHILIFITYSVDSMLAIFRVKVWTSYTILLTSRSRGMICFCYIVWFAWLIMLLASRSRGMIWLCYIAWFAWLILFRGMIWFCYIAWFAWMILFWFVTRFSSLSL